LTDEGVNDVYLGESEIRFGSRRQTGRKQHISSNYYYSTYKHVFDEYEINVDKCVIIDGCYDTNVQTLKRTLNPEVIGEHSGKSSYKFIKKTLFSTIRALFRKLKYIPTFPNLDVSCILNCRISKNTKPGYRFEELMYKKTKGEAINLAYNLAVKRWNVLNATSINEIKHENIFLGAYTIGARNKRDFDYDDNEVAVSRAVHMPELHALLTTSPWSDVIVNFIKGVKRGPIYIGDNLLDWFRFDYDLRNTKFAFEGD